MSSPGCGGLLEMKAIKSILLWFSAFFYFVFFLLFALLVSFIIDEKRYTPWLQAMLRFLFKIIGCPVTVEGLEKIDSEKTYLYMSNHVSLFDIPLLGGYLPGIVRGIEADRQHRWPLYGRVMRRLGNVPIERGNIHGSISTIRQTARLLDSGKSFIILPEGHRTLDGKLRPFKKLPFFLAKQGKKEILPVGISGLYQLKNKGSWMVQPVPLTIKFGDPILIDEIDSLTVVELRDQTRETIQSLIERP